MTIPQSLQCANTLHFSARERSIIPFHRYKTEAQRDVVTYPEQQEAFCNQAAQCLKDKHPSPQTCCLAPEHN